MRAATIAGILFILFVCGNLVFDAVSGQRGRAKGAADADRDLASGAIGIKGMGKPMYWQREYKHLLAERFSVNYEHVAGCVAGSFEAAYVFAYNEKMLPLVNERSIDFGQLRLEAKALADAQFSKSKQIDQ